MKSSLGVSATEKFSTSNIEMKFHPEKRKKNRKIGKKYTNTMTLKILKCILSSQASFDVIMEKNSKRPSLSK